MTTDTTHNFSLYSRDGGEEFSALAGETASDAVKVLLANGFTFEDGIITGPGGGQFAFNPQPAFPHPVGSEVVFDFKGATRKGKVIRRHGVSAEIEFHLNNGERQIAHSSRIIGKISLAEVAQ